MQGRFSAGIPLTGRLGNSGGLVRLLREIGLVNLGRWVRLAGLFE